MALSPSLNPFPGYGKISNMKRTLLFFDLDDTILQNPMVDAVFPAIFDHFRSYHRVDRWNSLERAEWDFISSISCPKIEAFDWDEMVQQVARKYGIPLIRPLRKWLKKMPILLISRYLTIAWSFITLKLMGNTPAIGTNGHWRYQKPVWKPWDCWLFDYILTPDLTGYLKGLRFLSIGS